MVGDLDLPEPGLKLRLTRTTAPGHVILGKERCRPFPRNDRRCGRCGRRGRPDTRERRRAGTPPGAGGRRWWMRLRAWMEVVSSAEITYSSPARGWPAKTRWYRSSTTPAFSANAGSRGKIHERSRHGRIASSESHRQIVVPEICSQMPRSIARRRMSARDRRESCSPSSRGSWQASALTSATTEGGNAGLRPRPGASSSPPRPCSKKRFSAGRRAAPSSRASQH